MNTLFCARSLKLEEMEAEVSSTKICREETFSVQYEQDDQSNSTDGFKKVTVTPGSYLVDYGPIRVRHRRTVSQTLATGRRSKDDPPVSDEEAAKREMRRAKNRIAARELKKSRDQIELNLIQQIKDLEEEKIYLEKQHKRLEEYKGQLNRAVYNAKQTPLIPFVADMNIPLFFEPQHGHDLLIDLQPLLQTIDEHFCLSEY